MSSGNIVFHSNGKLLISGEYFVLNGAKALAVPLKYGQNMEVRPVKDNNNQITWTLIEKDHIKVSSIYSCKTFEILKTSDKENALWLQTVLKAASDMRPDLFNNGFSYVITCSLDFSANWGWGSSSSLFSNLAYWLGIDHYEVNQKILSGSGYDIATSRSSTPIIYQIKNGLREITPVNFDPAFKEQIYFIYLGRKQKTSEGIKDFIQRNNDDKSSTHEISILTEQMASGNSPDEFMRLMREHEMIISKALNFPGIKDQYFNDFNGEIKSLGAWGGDFAMVVSPVDEKSLKNYFIKKGIKTIFKFKDIVLNKWENPEL